MWLLGHPEPGRLMKSEPKSKNGKFRHGYDARDRVVLTELYTEFEGRFYETFLEYFDDRVEATRYSYDAAKGCISVETLLLDGARPIAFLRGNFAEISPRGRICTQSARLYWFTAPSGACKEPIHQV